MVRRIKPVSHVIKIEGEINKFMNEVFFQRPEPFGLEEGWVPRLDIYEKENEIIVEVEVPGVTQRDILISLHASRIEVKGVKKENLTGERMKYLRLEREYGRFRRIVALPCSVYSEKAIAFLENGILTLILKKYKKKRGKEVMVKIQKSAG